ncbi:hypothetical protein GCM10010415_10690 [Streptomyces atrovirens]
MAAGRQVDGVVEELDQRHVGDLVGAWFQAPVGTVAGQVDHAHGVVRIRGSRALGALQTPQVNGQGVWARAIMTQQVTRRAAAVGPAAAWWEPETCRGHPSWRPPVSKLGRSRARC